MIKSIRKRATVFSMKQKRARLQPHTLSQRGEARESCAHVACRVISLLEIRLQTHLPVFGLVDPLRIGPRKVAFTVEGSDGCTELRHGVEVRGEIIQHGDNVGGKRCSLCPLLGNPAHLQGWRKEM